MTGFFESTSSTIFCLPKKCYKLSVHNTNELEASGDKALKTRSRMISSIDGKETVQIDDQRILEHFGYCDIDNGSGSENDRSGILMITFYVLIAQLLL